MDKNGALPAWDLAQLIAAVTGAAFALSVANLLGRYAALDSNFSYFLTVQDVLSNAIWIAPFLFLGMAFRVWSNLVAGATPATKVSTGKFLRARWFLAGSVVLAGIVFYALPPGSTIFLVLLLLLTYRSARLILAFKSEVGVIGEYALYFNDVFFLCIFLIAISYTLMISRMSATEPTHKICLSDSCREAILLDEINLGLVLRWKDDEVLSFIPTSQVESVSALHARSMRPIFDIFGIGDGKPKTQTSRPEQSTR